MLYMDFVRISVAETFHWLWQIFTGLPGAGFLTNDKVPKCQKVLVV